MEKHFCDLCDAEIEANEIAIFHCPTILLMIEGEKVDRKDELCITCYGDITKLVEDYCKRKAGVK